MAISGKTARGPPKYIRTPTNIKYNRGRSILGLPRIDGIVIFLPSSPNAFSTLLRDSGVDTTTRSLKGPCKMYHIPFASSLRLSGATACAPTALGCWLVEFKREVRLENLELVGALESATDISYSAYVIMLSP